MKKLLLLITLAFGLQPSAFSGTNASITLNTNTGQLSNLGFSSGGLGLIWSNSITGAWGQIPTNSHVHLTDEHGTTYDFHTNGALAIVQTNGVSTIISNGSITTSSNVTAGSEYVSGVVTISSATGTNVISANGETNATVLGAGQAYARDNGGDIATLGLVQIAGKVFLGGNVWDTNNLYVYGLEDIAGNLNANSMTISNGLTVDGAIAGGSFSGNFAGEFSGSGLLQDPRPTLEINPTDFSDSASVSLPSNSIYTMLTNNGPGTITRLEVSFSPTSSGASFATDTNFCKNSLITFYTDGITNQMRLSTLFAMWNAMYIQPGQRLEINALGAYNTGGGGTWAAQRDFEINAFTNFAVTVTCGAASSTHPISFFFRVLYKTGTPVCIPQRNYWHFVDTSLYLTNGQNATNTLASGTAGEMEWDYWNCQGTNSTAAAGLSFLEGGPIYYADGTKYSGQGGENFYGFDWYALGGTRTEWNDYHGTFGSAYGTVSTRTHFALSPGYTNGITLYAFLAPTSLDSATHRLLFTTSLTWSAEASGGFNQSVSNIWGKSFWTQNWTTNL